MADRNEDTTDVHQQKKTLNLHNFGCNGSLDKFNTGKHNYSCGEQPVVDDEFSRDHKNPKKQKQGNTKEIEKEAGGKR